MDSLNGIPYLFWGIAIAVPIWFLIHRRWMGLHVKDPLVGKHQASTYVAPSQACKAIERY